MKSIPTILFVTILLYFGSNDLASQHLTDVEMGTAVIDFLMTSPDKANLSNPAQATALSVIGSLYNSPAEKYQSGKSANDYTNFVSISYRFQTGEPSKVVRDKDGNAYLIFRGNKIPISRQLIYQAISVPVQSGTLNNLPPYEMEILSKEYYNKNAAASCLFTCTGYEDRDNNGTIALEECLDVKRSFYVNETLYIAYKYNNQSDLSTTFTISIIKESTIERVRYREFVVNNKEDNEIKFLPYKSPIELESGVYLIEVYHKFLKKNGKTARDGAFIKRERFEILD